MRFLKQLSRRGVNHLSLKLKCFKCLYWPHDFPNHSICIIIFGMPCPINSTATTFHENTAVMFVNAFSKALFIHEMFEFLVYDAIACWVVHLVPEAQELWCQESGSTRFCFKGKISSILMIVDYCITEWLSTSSTRFILWE